MIRRRFPPPDLDSDDSLVSRTICRTIEDSERKCGDRPLNLRQLVQAIPDSSLP